MNGVNTEAERIQGIATGAFVCGVTVAAMMIQAGDPIPETHDDVRAFLGRAQSQALVGDPDLRGLIDGDLNMIDPRRV